LQLKTILSADQTLTMLSKFILAVFTTVVLSSPNKTTRITTDLPIEYHQQETDFYCGAACAQMVLQQSRVGVPHTTNPCDGTDEDCDNITDLCQHCLYVDSWEKSAFYTSEGQDWYSLPDGLEKTLNDRRPPAFAQRFRFVLFEETDKTIITKKIIWTIHHYQVAPIVLILENEENGGLHWVTVKGYESNSDPVSADDPDFNINSVSGFWIHDSWPSPRYPAPPPPHETDDDCGSGTVNGINRGEANKFVTLHDWNQHYLARVSTGHWQNKFLAICDPDKPKMKRDTLKNQQIYYSGKKPMDTTLAKELAKKALTDYNLINKPFLAKELSDIYAGSPLLVRRIDREKDFYYIVPFLNKNNQTKGLVNIDALHGNLKQATFPGSNGIMRDHKPFSKNEIAGLIMNYQEKFFKKKMVIVPKTIKISPNWVWKPCKESLSANYPFQKVKYKDKIFYVRIDGIIFPGLTTSGKGM
jgi:hypothetical protein